MSVLANYFVFMTFFPACVSLVLEVRMICKIGENCGLFECGNEFLCVLMHVCVYSCPGKVARAVQSGS